tara:strand:- start:489 stop:740 length:252 start_codon:yes stop_codon:yes gene_type:complete
MPHLGALRGWIGPGQANTGRIIQGLTISLLPIAPTPLMLLVLTVTDFVAWLRTCTSGVGIGITLTPTVKGMLGSYNLLNEAAK